MVKIDEEMERLGQKKRWNALDRIRNVTVRTYEKMEWLGQMKR